MMKMFQHLDGSILKHPSGVGLDPPDWTYLGDVPEGIRPEYAIWDGVVIVADLAPAWALLRTNRDQRLAASDKMMLPDYPISEEQQAAWATYRQALRDLPENTADPTNPDWPETPE